MPLPPGPSKEMQWSRFPGLEQPVPSMAWCVQNEYCCTPSDYMRRRTNIAQWVPREGLGFHDENVSHIAELCTLLPGPDLKGSHQLHLQEYVRGINEGFDRLTGAHNATKGAFHEAV